MNFSVLQILPGLVIGQGAVSLQIINGHVIAPSKLAYQLERIRNFCHAPLSLVLLPRSTINVKRKQGIH